MNARGGDGQQTEGSHVEVCEMSLKMGVVKREGAGAFF